MNFYSSNISHLSNNVVDVIINISLSVNGVGFHTSVNIIFEEEVLEGQQIFFLESNDHLIAQAK